MKGRAKVLIVEDSQDVRTLLELALTHSGFRIFSAPNGSSGLLQMDIVKPDLIILDVLMPGLDDWETLKRVREISDVPVIVLTARDDPKTRIHCQKYGADGCMTKPVDLPVLNSMAQGLIGRPQRAGGLSRDIGAFQQQSVHPDPTRAKVLPDHANEATSCQNRGANGQANVRSV
jgi:DNA-binding response OmpR family regulator